VWGAVEEWKAGGGNEGMDEKMGWAKKCHTIPHLLLPFQIIVFFFFFPSGYSQLFCFCVSVFDPWDVSIT
jgi:hypothetical protein